MGIGIDACGQHRPDQHADFRGPPAEGLELALLLGVKRAAAAVAQRVAVALWRARAFPVAAVGSASGNIIVRRKARGGAPALVVERMFARCRIFHDRSICALCGRLISDHT
jgi:hypothetical protein